MLFGRTASCNWWIILAVQLSGNYHNEGAIQEVEITNSGGVGIRDTLMFAKQIADGMVSAHVRISQQQIDKLSIDLECAIRLL